jgi:hypothetical protein
MKNLFFINLLMLGFILSMSSCGEDDVDDVTGCTDDTACNYDADATIEGDCDFLSCVGCTDTSACNYNTEAWVDNDSCVYDSDLPNPIDIIYIEDVISGSVGEELVSHVHIQNNSCEDATLKVRKIFPNSTASAYFCFNGICFPSSETVSPNPLTLSSGEVDDYFKGYLIADSPGSYAVTYRFYLETDPTQNKEVTITYNVN